MTFPTLASAALVKRANTASWVSLACVLVADIYLAVSHSHVALLFALATSLECLLAWTARTAWGWVVMTPKRINVIRLIRSAPLLLDVLSVVLILILSLGEVNKTVPYMIAFLMLQISVVAAAIAGSSRAFIPIKNSTGAGR